MSDRRMFRYVVPVDDQSHVFTLTGDPVAVAGSDFEVEFWAEHNEDADASDRAFQVFGSGHPLPADGRWIGTSSRTPRGLVWHLYEVTQ